MTVTASTVDFPRAIAAWAVAWVVGGGVLGAAVGETRKLLIPAHEGYGAGGFPAWGIPPGGTLQFEIEVLKIAGKGEL